MKENVHAVAKRFASSSAAITNEMEFPREQNEIAVGEN
jgi:hypothetical protein